jgi:nitrogen fixation/metabolism regulation signal transduction histidine kinase
MHERLNTLWARLLIGVGIPLALFLGVAGVSSVVINRLIAAFESENEAYAVIAANLQGNGALKAELEDLSARREATLESNRHSLILIGITSGVALVFTLILVVQTVRGITRPVKKLEQAAAEMLAGKFPPVPANGPTEIARLISHFNHMALTLMDRTVQLQAKEERYRTYVGAVS